MLKCGNTRKGWRATLRHAWPAMLASQAGLLAVLGAFLVLLACVGNVWMGGGALNAAHQAPALHCQFGIAHGDRGPQCSMPQPK